MLLKDGSKDELVYFTDSPQAALSLFIRLVKILLSPPGPNSLRYYLSSPTTVMEFLYLEVEYDKGYGYSYVRPVRATV